MHHHQVVLRSPSYCTRCVLENNVDELYCISNATKEEPVMAECLRSILLGRLNPSLAPALRSPISQTNVYHRYIDAAPRKNPQHSHQACATHADMIFRHELTVYLEGSYPGGKWCIPNEKYSGLRSATNCLSDIRARCPEPSRPIFIALLRETVAIGLTRINRIQEKSIESIRSVGSTGSKGSTRSIGLRSSTSS